MNREIEVYHSVFFCFDSMSDLELLTGDSPLTRRISVCKKRFFIRRVTVTRFADNSIKNKEVEQIAIPSQNEMKSVLLLSSVIVLLLTIPVDA